MSDKIQVELLKYADSINPHLTHVCKMDRQQEEMAADWKHEAQQSPVKCRFKVI